ncbi:MAG: ribonuclease Rnj [Roseibaca calidilacus]|uniref:Ribonuclease J n=1 Tax=Roseibaca calidilacus TaxID=1666912 RepID=A0A0P7WMA9_9RHOB|nr:ribonuclease J [Roseibaca calidilacus]KPP91973.1 MAG: ribonuclease Rnj [Roseibaca calidilacus]CUX82200.1 ribonuclease J [Roseibaca calidilacus]
MSAERLIYVPLGGAGEVGMNAYLYGYGPKGRERFILVDLGITFPDMGGQPGVDVILPDLTWLEERRDRLDAIFITHAHEDHVGAVGQMWDRLQAPVYARDFTARIAQLKMQDQGQDPAQIKTVGKMEPVKAGPFTVQFFPVAHSLPEASGMIIDTPAGRVVHSGDFKADTTPGVGEPHDPAMLAEIGRSGVKALMCDSTNVMNKHAGRSEATLAGPIADLMRDAKGMVVATTFASNVARLKTLAVAAQEAGRSVCLMGRAMLRMTQVATEAGILKDFPPTVSPEQAKDIPRENLLLIVTGSQGERRAASAQLARGTYMGLSMKEGDTFLFSSMTIPGNEREVGRIVNGLSEMGVDVIDNAERLYHVSGHANRPDLEAMHDLIQPAILVPMHGEHRMMREHAKLALSRGMRSVVVPNGSVLDLTDDVPVLVDEIPTGRIYLDGSRLIGAMDGIVRDRIRMAIGGHVFVTVIMDEVDEVLGDPWAEIAGLRPVAKGGQPLNEVIEDELSDFLERASRKVLADDDKLNDGLRRVVRQVVMEELGKKPEVTIVVSRLSAE